MKLKPLKMIFTGVPGAHKPSFPSGAASQPPAPEVPFGHEQQKINPPSHPAYDLARVGKLPNLLAKNHPPQAATAMNKSNVIFNPVILPQGH